MWKIVDTRHEQPIETYETLQAAQEALDILRKNNDRLIAVPDSYIWNKEKQTWTA